MTPLNGSIGYYIRMRRLFVQAQGMSDPNIRHIKLLLE